MLDAKTSIREEIARLCIAQAAVHADLLVMVAEMDASATWRDDGSASASSWLVAHHGLNHRTAAEWVRVARALRNLPELQARYAAGSLSWDQLRVVTRFATADEDTELAETAPEMSSSQLEREARRRQRVSLADAQRAHRDRFLALSWDEQAHGAHLRGFLPDDQAVTLAKALARTLERSPTEPESGVFEDYPTRMADALWELASASLGADADPDRATVVIHVDASVLHGGDGVAEVEHGPVLAPDTALRLMCDCRYEATLADKTGRTIGIGRTSRTIPPWLARQVRKRDGGCRFPGCERVQWTQIHHLVYWSRGGRTDLDNLICLCGYHHRLVHEGGWRIAGDPDGEITWIRPNGRPWEPHGLMLGPIVRTHPNATIPPRLRTNGAVGNGQRRADLDTS